MDVTGQGQKIAADEHGLGFFLKDGRKELLEAGDSAVKVGNKKARGHEEMIAKKIEPDNSNGLRHEDTEARAS